MYKRFLTLFFVGALALTLIGAGCGNKEEQNNDNATTETATVPIEGTYTFTSDTIDGVAQNVTGHSVTFDNGTYTDTRKEGQDDSMASYTIDGDRVTFSDWKMGARDVKAPELTGTWTRDGNNLTITYGVYNSGQFASRTAVYEVK